jgi:hypothetical protein
MVTSKHLYIAMSGFEHYVHFEHLCFHLLLLYETLKYTQRGLVPVYSTSLEVWLPLFFNLISPLIDDQILAEERREKSLLSTKPPEFTDQENVM